MAACQRFVQLAGWVGGKNSTDQSEGNIDSPAFQHVHMMPPQQCWTDGANHLGGTSIRNQGRCTAFTGGYSADSRTSTVGSQSTVAEICICVASMGNNHYSEDSSSQC